MRHRRSEAIVTTERFELDFSFPSSDWIGAFDRLEIFRSRATQDGPYDALHGPTYAPATLPVGFSGAPSGAGPSVAIVGLALELLVNETIPISVTFTGVNPITYAAAAAQVVAAAAGLLFSFASGSDFVVQTTGVGEAMILRCTGGDAAPLLGLATTEPDNLAFGQDARIVLTLNQEQYGFADAHGSPLFWYRSRFYSSTTQLTSDYSLPFRGPQAPGLPQSDMVRCYVDLVDLSGVPFANQEVLIYNRFSGTQIDGKTVTGGSARLLTDVSGHAELLLPRGLDAVVSIPGTSLARDFTVPTDPTIQSISMLDPSVSVDDVFTVQQSNLPAAARTSLG